MTQLQVNGKTVEFENIADDVSCRIRCGREVVVLTNDDGCRTVRGNFELSSQEEISNMSTLLDIARTWLFLGGVK